MSYRRTVELPVSASTAYAWHDRSGAFARLVPPWERVRVLSCDSGLRDGNRVEMAVGIGPLNRSWVAEIRDVVPGCEFSDIQIEGPFRSWRHRHTFDALGDDRCRLTDEVHYALPGGRVGEVAAGAAIERKLDRLFGWRHGVTLRDLAQWASERHLARRRIVVTGSSGLVGSSLVPYLQAQGQTVLRARRQGADLGDNDIKWSTSDGELGGGAVDAVVHLAGENIASRRWSQAQMAAIRESRVAATRALCEHLAARTERPEVVVVASAIGFYGDRGNEELDETSSRGTGFLADVCAEWEDATAPARDAGIRVVNLRFGVILDPRQGALARLLTPFRLGLGGPVGNGRQMMSWVSREDAVRAVGLALMDEELVGPVNVVAPEPVDNRGFTRALGRTLRRPTVLPMPGFAARMAFGRMADELLLASTAVVPSRLMERGFVFQHPTIEGALTGLLGQSVRDR